MIVAIQDANILIDLHKTGLLEAYFLLGMETHTTDLVLSEVEQELAPFVKTGQLRVEVLNDVELMALLDFKVKQPPALSLQDCSVFRLAIQKQAILLTGDNRLRTHAEKSKVEVHGALWLFDLMVEKGILDLGQAIDRLKHLMQTNPRLPADACDERLKKWAAGLAIAPKRPTGKQRK